MVAVVQRAGDLPLQVSRERAVLQLDQVLHRAIVALNLALPHRVVGRPAGVFPNDNMVLEAAVAGQGDAIVSGDNYLLTLKSFKGIPIIAPAAFLKKLKSQARE